MSNQPLFFEVSYGAEFSKVAEERSVKLPEDDSKWSQAITDHLASEVSHLNRYPTEIYIDEKDSKLGTAKGRVVIANKITAPIIINKFKMSPVDVMIHEDKFMPLSEKNLDSVLMHKNLVDKTVSKEESTNGEGGGLRGGSSPPHSAQGLGGRKMASAQISEADFNSFDKRLKDDPVIAYKIASKSKGILSVLREKVATVDKVLTGIDAAKRDSEAEGWECDVVQITKNASNKYDLYMSSDKCPLAYDHKELTEKEAAKFIGAEGMRKVASGEPHSVVKGRSGSCINLPSELAFPTEDLEKFGHYDVITKNKSVVRGYIIPEVYDFSMKKSAGMKLFINPNMYSMQEKIAGRRVMAGPPAELPSHDLREGVTGTFCFKYGAKTAAMEPFRITSFPLTSGEQIDFEATSSIGEPIHMTVMPGLASAAPGEKRGHYLVPSIWQFVQVGSHSEDLYSNPGDAIKTAEADLDNKKIEIVWDGAYFQFIGEQVRNISQQVKDLDTMKARFLLTAFGLTPEFADKMLKKAKDDGYSEVRATIKPTGKYVMETNSVENTDGSRSTKFASGMEWHLEECSKHIRGLADWVKTASEGADKDTVDSILSLNFVNKTNINEYVNSIEDLKETQEKLAKLLVASRLGIKQVESGTVKTAMEVLGEVIEDLEILRSVGIPEKKTK